MSPSSRTGAAKKSAHPPVPASTASSGPKPFSAKTAASKPAAVNPRFAGKHIHFIGIGGCGMSGLALMLQQLGAVCGGSDAVSSELTEALDAAGIPVRLEQTSGMIPGKCDLVIASAAIKPDHPEMLAAVNRGITVWTYAEALGQVQADKTGISLAGTHGKSTTTAMLAHVLIECGFDPSFIVGATCPQIGGGSRTGAITIPKGTLAGKPGTLIAEACEFNRSFHHHRPTIGLINNIEEDHLDIYASLDEIITAFAGFAQLIASFEKGGRLLIAHDGAHRMKITPGLKCGIETFGFHPEAHYQVVYDAAVQRVGVLQDGIWLGQWTIQMPGAHNALNSTAAGILAHYLGADWDEIAAALSTFRGLDRRMQKLGKRSINGGDVIVYDDYGHHPTEIENTLRALRNAECPKRLICVFQPHQHSRTRFLLEQFAQSFSSADVVIVPHIYFVRDSEVEKSKVSASDLVDKLRGRGVQAMHLYPFEAIVEQLETICRPGDLLVIMGAGPVWKVAKGFLEEKGFE
jgi:UDP-N-acetylmuramate--alanine ligase